MQVQARDAAGQGDAALAGPVSRAAGVVEEAAGGAGEAVGTAVVVVVRGPDGYSSAARTKEVRDGWWWCGHVVGCWPVWAEECDVWRTWTRDCCVLEGGSEGGWRVAVWTDWTAADAVAAAADDDDHDDAGNGTAAGGVV
jgi:hypothetical protein